LQKRKWNKVKLGGKKRIIYDDSEGFLFPYAEAEELGISRTTQHWKNMKTLYDMGFIDIIHQGGWYQKHEKEKDYSIYKISNRWRQYGTPNFKPVEKKKVLQPDYYIRENLKRQKTKATSRKRSGQLHESEDDRGKKEKNRLHETEVVIKPECTAERLTRSEERGSLQ
jgi:hypothetical protein